MGILEGRIGPAGTSTSDRAALLIVEDDGHVGRAMHRVVSRQLHAVVAGSMENALACVQGDEATEWVGAIVDIGLPDGSGLELARTLRRLRPGLPVLVVTGTDSRIAPSVAVEAGAQFAFKPVSTSTIVAFVDRAIASRPGARIDAVVRSLARDRGLSEREEDVARLSARGVPRAELGERLAVTENTVKTQVRSVLVKCGETSLDELVRRILRAAVERGV